MTMEGAEILDSIDIIRVLDKYCEYSSLVQAAMQVHNKCICSPIPSAVAVPKSTQLFGQAKYI